MGKRREMFREELLYALKMLQEGVVKRRAFRSSWAGAVGLTSSCRRNISPWPMISTAMGGVISGPRPTALASAANQLKKKGWETGKTWGFEVRLPASVTCAMDGPAGARKIGEWAKLGVRRVAKREFPKSYLKEEAFLLTPGGGHGPAFLVLENFMVFKRYNPSDLYALFVELWLIASSVFPASLPVGATSAASNPADRRRAGPSEGGRVSDQQGRREERGEYAEPDRAL